MKLDNYELVISFAMPCYLYIEGESKEKFYVYTNNIHLCKWLVNESYHELVYDDSDDDTDYEYYDWDFKNHCVKKD